MDQGIWLWRRWVVTVIQTQTSKQDPAEDEQRVLELISWYQDEFRYETSEWSAIYESLFQPNAHVKSGFLFLIISDLYI